MDNAIILNGQKIENMIYEVRGKPVMLDSDLARLYQCKNGTKSINLAVKRNIDRFPKRYYFQLNALEYNDLCQKRFQNETTRFNMTRILPYVFTQEGVAMLATVLKTAVASKISVAIMDAFGIMRKYISNELIEQSYINKMVIQHDEDIKMLQEALGYFYEKNKTNEIYYNGQIYDAYSKLLDIMRMAKRELIIIDNFADKSVLDMIKGLKVNVILICRSTGGLKEIDIKKYLSQYNNLKVIYNNTYHDRYLILDRFIIYHCGTSLNYAGSKTFSINRLEDKVVIDSLINKIKNEENI